MEIRLVQESDILKLKKAFGGDFTNFHDQRFEDQKENRGLYIICLIDDQPVAHVLVRFNKFVEQVGDLEFYLIAFNVLEKFQSKGVGTAILNFIEKIAKNDFKKNKLHLAVAINNFRGINFYQRNGFQIISEPIMFQADFLNDFNETCHWQEEVFIMRKIF